jgi:membrane-associated phospholipid phosphatase
MWPINPPHPTPDPTIWRRELVVVRDLVAACAIVQLLLDGWIATILRELQSSPAIAALRLLPDRKQLSLVATFLMVLLIVRRIVSGSRLYTDRGMFVVGCGVVAGYAADKLKIIFGRSPPEALLTDGVYGFHFFEGGTAFDSFPSCHAAMAAAVAAAASVVWPFHRRLFIGLAACVAASRFIVGERYASDTVLGFAVGIGIVVLMHIVFHYCGIELRTAKDSS